MDGRRIGEILVDTGHISAPDVEEALAFQREAGALFGQALLRLGAVSEDALLSALSDQLGIPVATAAEVPADDAVLAAAAIRLGLPLRWLAAKEAVVWFDDGAGHSDSGGEGGGERAPEGEGEPGDGGDIVLLARQPLDPALSERVEAAARSRPVRRRLASNRVLDAALARVRSASEARAEAELSDAERLREMAEEAPVIDFVNALFEDALRDGASDVHVEPFEREFKVRFRVDGVLNDVQVQPRSRFDAVASRIKLISGMDIAERRLPQDGRQTIRFAGEEVDLRVSSLPGAWGESIVMRLLRKRQELPSLEGLGLAGAPRAAFDRMIREPNGVVLVTGPTGSGKSTTLYRALERVNGGDRKIITIEDPIEYDMDGITQVQARSDIGYSFARGLRAILRQDPDVIMIGEIRDGETAQIAVQAALTGHLVFSTLHTNSSLAAVERLKDLGVEPFLISAALRGLVAQRLVRRLCEQCAAPASRDTVSLAETWLEQAADDGAKLAEFSDAPLWREAVGCDACRGQGYQGRLAVYEAVRVEGALREEVAHGAGSSKLQAAARDQGFLTLFEDGLAKARLGLTSLAEVQRVLGASVDEPLLETGG